MFKARITNWNLHKNLKKADKASLIRKVRQTKGAGQLVFKGRPVQMHRLVRYCKENNVPPADLEPAALREQRRRSISPLNFGVSGELAALGLQSLFRSPSQPSWPIAMDGDMRTAEVILWNTETYLNFYFTTGPGTQYFKVDPTMAACKALVKNEEAWNGIVEPKIMARNIRYASYAWENGFPHSAFEAADEASGLVKTLFEQQAPTLLAQLINALAYGAKGDFVFANNMRQFILDMAATVLGDEHPLSMILNSLSKLSSAVDKYHVRRAVTDAFDRCFEGLGDSGLLIETRTLHLYGLVEEGLMKEAQDYSDVIHQTGGRIAEQDPIHFCEAACLLPAHSKYIEAEIQYRRWLDLLKEAEDDVLAEGTSSCSLGRLRAIYGCQFGLALVLEFMDRIDEAKAIWRRALKFVCAAYGPDSIETQVTGSQLDDCLTENGCIEESAALRAQFPCLLRRKVLALESL